MIRSVGGLAGIDQTARDAASAAQDTADAVVVSSFTEAFPVSTDLKSSATVSLVATVTSWMARSNSTASGAGGGPSVFEIDSNGKLHLRWASGTLAGSSNFAWLNTSLKGSRLLAAFRPTMLPSTSAGYMEWGVVGLKLDSGQSNQVLTGTFMIGPTFNLRPSNFADTATTEYHHIDVVLQLVSGTVSIVFRDTRGSTTSTIGSLTYAGSLVTGVDLKLRVTSSGTVTAYYRATGGGSYTLISGSVGLADLQISAFGVGSGNNTGTTSAADMDFRIDSCSHTYSA